MNTEQASAEHSRETIDLAVEALVRFKREFNRDLTPSVLGELYVARELGLVPVDLCNHLGYDLLGGDGKRYQVKQRGENVLNVDVNNFDFDYLMLVNLGEDYALKGVWRLDADDARKLFVLREKFRKYQATQKVVKAKGTEIAYESARMGGKEMARQIAILGWGSLIWCPGSLLIKSAWHRDGPPLPIEFARVSNDGRLTLVIHPESPEQQTLWAAAVSEDLNVVRKNLQKREGTSPELIHSATADGHFSGSVSKVVCDAVTKWLKEHPDFQACVWTGLPSNWKSDFTVSLAIQYLKNLPVESRARAREYIQNAPGQIQTAVRAAARNQLLWDDAALSPTLFA